MIECQLLLSEIASGAIDYEAVSYTWGTAKDVDFVLIDGQRVKIGLNLSLILRDLRLPDTERTLWIDAICINQDDNGERSHQVQRMGNIYRHAWQVLFCLGRPTEMTDAVFAALSDTEQYITTNQGEGGALSLGEPNSAELLEFLHGRHFAPKLRVKQGYKTILEESWFYRVWIIQEAANANR